MLEPGGGILTGFRTDEHDDMIQRHVIGCQKHIRTHARAGPAVTLAHRQLANTALPAEKFATRAAGGGLQSRDFRLVLVDHGLFSAGNWETTCPTGYGTSITHRQYSMNAVLGGVVAALAWGSADFVARFTGGAVGHVRALFGMLTASAVVLSGVVYVMDLPIADTSRGWWLVLLTGVGLTVATLLLYQGLVRGPVSIVAPIAGTFPAFNILLALILGIRPGGLEWLAMATVIAGVVIVARSAGHFEARGVHSRSELRRTVFIAIAASFGFAVTVAAGQEAGEVYGDVQARVPGALGQPCLLCPAAGRAPRDAADPPRWWPALAAQGVLDGAALVAVVAGSQGAASAVTAVLASTFSAVTVVLARLFMREVMSRGQWLGIGLIIAGVMTLSGLQS